MSTSEPIRVLHVITRMVKGGAQENTLANVTGIHGAEWQSTLVTGPAEGPEGSLEPKCEARGVRILHVPDLVREVSPRSDWTALRALTRLMRKELPHIVHTHTSKAGILGRIAARRTGVPAVVHTPHGHVFHSYESGLKTKLFIGAERFCAPMADRLIALTPNELREHLEVGVGTAAQWTVVHSGVDFAPFEAARGSREEVRAEMGMPPDATVIGTVGRLVPIKDQATLIDAVARIKLPNLHLLLVGDGPLRGDLVARAREHGLGIVEYDAQPGSTLNARTFTPREPARGWGGPERLNADRPTLHLTGLREDVPRLMTAMDIFALPSLNEGMGRVLVEAMAMELPCVATRVSGIPDVVEERETGVLVPPRDAEAFSTILEAMVRHPDAAREMGEKGRRRVVPEFGLPRMLEKLEAVYRELVQEKCVRPGEYAPNPSAAMRA